MARLRFLAPARIVANLPYGVATPLLISWLKTEPWPPWFDRMVLMFQREVAERIVASPGGKDYGRLAVLVAVAHASPRILFTVPAEAFTPRPKVDFGLGRACAEAHASSRSCDVGALERVTAAAFGQRRKMLRAALRQIAPDSELPSSKARHRPQIARRGTPGFGVLPHRQCASARGARKR